MVGLKTGYPIRFPPKLVEKAKQRQKDFFEEHNARLPLWKSVLEISQEERSYQKSLKKKDVYRGFRL